MKNNKKRFLFTKKNLVILIISTLVLIALISSISGIIYTFSNSIETEKGVIADAVINIALGIFAGLVAAVVGLVIPIIKVLLLTLQNLIFILTLYPLIQNVFEINYLVFIGWSLGAFFVLTIFFCILQMFKKVNNYEHFFDWKNLFKAILYLFLFPIIMLLVMASGQAIGDLIFGIDNIYTISFFDLIYSTTIGNTAIDWGNGIFINSAEAGFKAIMFILASGFSIYFLFFFVISLAVRIFELITFGTIGIIISTSSMAYDEGERFNTWSIIMLQKILIPLFSIFGFICFLEILPNFLEAINNISDKWFIFGVEIETKCILSLVSIAGGCLILKSLSTEWAFIIAGKNNKASFATEMNSVMNDIKAPFNTALNIGSAGFMKGKQKTLELTEKLTKAGSVITKKFDNFSSKDLIKPKKSESSTEISISEKNRIIDERIKDNEK